MVTVKIPGQTSTSTTDDAAGTQAQEPQAPQDPDAPAKVTPEGLPAADPAGDHPEQTALDQAAKSAADDKNAMLQQVAADSHTPQPQVEFRIPEVGAIEHNVGYVDESGNAVPVASQYDVIHQKSINAPDYPAASGLATQGAPLTIGGNVYTAVKVPNGGGVEYYPQGKEEKQLFHNIPGVPAGYVALTPAGEEALKAEGLLDGESTSQANGVPVYKLKSQDSTSQGSTSSSTSTSPTAAATSSTSETPTTQDYSVQGHQPDSSLQPDPGQAPDSTQDEGKETLLPDGTKETEYSDGSKKQVKSDGSTVYVSADGTVSDTAPAGSKAEAAGT